MISYVLLGFLVVVFIQLCRIIIRGERKEEQLNRTMVERYLKLKRENADLQRQLAQEVAKKLGEIK